jgi:hypothetical protein
MFTALRRNLKKQLIFLSFYHIYTFFINFHSKHEHFHSKYIYLYEFVQNSCLKGEVNYASIVFPKMLSYKIFRKIFNNKNYFNI